MQSLANSRITEQQLDLLKSFKYLTDEQQIREVKELLHLYYRHKLDAAIDNAEPDRNYSAEVYESWLKTKENGAL